MNPRLQLRLLRKPDAIKKPVYLRVQLIGGVSVDRREKWRSKWDAQQSEKNRQDAILQSTNVRSK